MRRNVFVPIVICVMCMYAGCAVKSAPPTDFAEQVPVNMNKEIPFQKFWVKEDVDWSKYERIFVAEVNTDHLLEMNWWDQVGRTDEINKDIRALSKYTRKAFNTEFFRGLGSRYRVVKEPGLHTLLFEVALIEVVPTKPVFAQLALGATIASAGTAADNLGNPGSIAFEARVRDAATNEVLMLIADREKGKKSILNTKNFKWYAHAYEIIDDWAKQVVDVANRDEYDTVERRSRFELKPW